nr:hypothetical protein [Bacillus licheniformis]
MKNKLKNAVHYIEANRDEMGDKKALDLLIKALKKIVLQKRLFDLKEAMV